MRCPLASRRRCAGSHAVPAVGIRSVLDALRAITVGVLTGGLLISGSPPALAATLLTWDITNTTGASRIRARETPNSWARATSSSRIPGGK